MPHLNATKIKALSPIIRLCKWYRINSVAVSAASITHSFQTKAKRCRICLGGAGILNALGRLSAIGRPINEGRLKVAVPNLSELCCPILNPINRLNLRRTGLCKIPDLTMVQSGSITGRTNISLRTGLAFKKHTEDKCTEDGDVAKASGIFSDGLMCVGLHERRLE